MIDTHREREKGFTIVFEFVLIDCPIKGPDQAYLQLCERVQVVEDIVGEII